MHELNPRLGGVSFFRPSGTRAITRLLRSRPVGATAVAAPWYQMACAMAKPARQCPRSYCIRQQLLGYQGRRDCLGLTRPDLLLAMLVAGAGIEPATYG